MELYTLSSEFLNKYCPGVVFNGFDANRTLTEMKESPQIKNSFEFSIEARTFDELFSTTCEIFSGLKVSLADLISHQSGIEVGVDICNGRVVYMTKSIGDIVLPLFAMNILREDVDISPTRAVKLQEGVKEKDESGGVLASEFLRCVAEETIFSINIKFDSIERLYLSRMHLNSMVCAKAEIERCNYAIDQSRISSINSFVNIAFKLDDFDWTDEDDSSSESEEEDPELILGNYFKRQRGNVSRLKFEEKAETLLRTAAAAPKKEDPAIGTCVICMDSKSTVAIIPCGHVCFCAPCAVRTKDESSEWATCPCCREPSFSMVSCIF